MNNKRRPEPRPTEASEQPISHDEALIDEGIDESFPASDPPAIGSATRKSDVDRSPKNARGRTVH
jgi:hypothetical protein